MSFLSDFINSIDWSCPSDTGPFVTEEALDNSVIARILNRFRDPDLDSDSEDSESEAPEDEKSVDWDAFFKNNFYDFPDKPESDSDSNCNLTSNSVKETEKKRATENEVVAKETYEEEGEAVAEDTKKEESEAVAEETDKGNSDSEGEVVVVVVIVEDEEKSERTADESEVVVVVVEETSETKGEGLCAALQHVEERVPPPLAHTIKHELAQSKRGFTARVAAHPTLCVGGGMRRHRRLCHRRDRRVRRDRCYRCCGRAPPLGFLPVERHVANM